VSDVRPVHDSLKDPGVLGVGFPPVRRNHLLDSLPPAAFDVLAPHLVQTTHAKDSVLQSPGRPIQRVYFPYTGLIALVTGLEEGRFLDTVAVGREGAVGLSAGMGAQTAYSMAVVRFPVTGAEISAARFAEIAARSKPLRDLSTRYADALLAQVQQRLVCNTVHPVQERICGWLLHAHDRVAADPLAVTQEALAEALGVQRTTVTMNCRTLQSQGIIHVRRGRISIQNLAALERTACSCYRIERQLTNAVNRSAAA